MMMMSVVLLQATFVGGRSTAESTTGVTIMNLHNWYHKMAIQRDKVNISHLNGDDDDFSSWLRVWLRRTSAAQCIASRAASTPCTGMMRTTEELSRAMQWHKNQRLRCKETMMMIMMTMITSAPQCSGSRAASTSCIMQHLSIHQDDYVNDGYTTKRCVMHCPNRIRSSI